jgi:excinuclease UvrABC nuclease subunit
VLAHKVEFRPERDAEVFAEAPAASAVFLLRGPSGEPYVSKTANLKRRLMRLLSPPEERTKRLNLRERVREIEYTQTGSDFEAGLLLYRVLKREFPDTYRDRMKLRPATLVKLNLDNPYPRAHLTKRLGARNSKSLYYGPFATRAQAEKFLNDALDQFKSRRCDFDLNPDPQFPGCIYSEMKMCLAPCFKGCTDKEYAAEVGRVQAFLDSGGQSLVRELGAQREKASEELRFEDAAALHTRVEKVQGIVQPIAEIVRRLDRLSGLLVLPSAAPGHVNFIRLEAAKLGEPFAFPVQQQEGKPQSMESRVMEALGEHEVAPAKPSAEVTEELALLKRWYYRSTRVGEIFLADDKGELPMRRVVRGISRVLKGEKAEADPETTQAREYWLARTRPQEESGN